MSSRSILPSGEELNLTPIEVLRYVNPDGLRQVFRQERIRWNLKPNKDSDYYSNTTLHKYSSDLHNEGLYMRQEIRTFPDNDAYPGYAGINIDSGEFGIVHELELWDHAISKESLEEVINRVQIGAMAKVPKKIGYGLCDETKDMIKDTDNRQAAILFDPYDGRAYYYSNDDVIYTNNERRSLDTRLPLRTLARIADIPTRITDLKNDLNFVSDPHYTHTSNDYTTSNRFVVDNLDDRTFVFPEIAKNTRGEYIHNFRIGLGGVPDYGEADRSEMWTSQRFNSQPDLGLILEIICMCRRDEHCDCVKKIMKIKIDTGEWNIDLLREGCQCVDKEPWNRNNCKCDEKFFNFGDRFDEKISAFNHNRRFSGVHHPPGYFPGIFRSIEELERVDLVGQTRTPLTHAASPGGRRSENYYIFDGIWSPTWFDRFHYNDSYMAQPLHPTNMETILPDREPIPFSRVDQTTKFHRGQLYQWRYNRISLNYHTKDIKIMIVESGQEYQVDDTLRWSIGEEVLLYKVEVVGPNGQIQRGSFFDHIPGRIFDQNPSTHGVGIPFTNMSNVGHGAKLSVFCPVTITTHATQIKNNLYAYVDVVPVVRSDNTTPWSDVNPPTTQDGIVNIRSSAAFPGHTGINSGRGGSSPNTAAGGTRYHEHGGNATAGTQVHLFRYIINTQNPTWVIQRCGVCDTCVVPQPANPPHRDPCKNGIQVFTGRWVDQGPLGVERPCDIKALFLSNYDTNNFNNYYKFMADILFDNMNKSPDAITTNSNSVAMVYMHMAQKDPDPELRFTEDRVDPNTSLITKVDITDKVMYINAATGIVFFFNTSHKNDPKFGYGNRPKGWFPLAGAVTR